MVVDLGLSKSSNRPSNNDIPKISYEYRELIKEYCSAVRKHFGERLVSICVFGSVARGEATAESDTDILVVAGGLPLDVGLRTQKTNYIHTDLKKTSSYRSLRKLGKCGLISDIFLAPEEVKKHPPILLDIIEDGVLFYDKDEFLVNILESLKEKLKRLGAKKVVTKKGYYWILKPDIKPAEVVEI